MSKTDTLTPLLSALRDLLVWLKTNRVPCLLIGGVAASLLGRPRVTRDIDILALLDEHHWEKLLASASHFGLSPRRPDALTFAKKRRVLLVHHEPSGIDADVVFAALPFEREAIARSRWVDVGGLSLPLPVPEDLIIMKAVANRPRDLGDIESILDAHPGLDLRRVRRWVREFSAALKQTEILDDLERILAKKRRQKRLGKRFH